MKHAVLIAIGDELLSGIRREGNCSWLAWRLTRAGWKVDCIEILPDGKDSLSKYLKNWVGTTDLLVLSGGLGPTHDDCTREALSSFLKVPLETADDAYDKVIARYPADMRILLEKCRDTQGTLPRGTRAVHNPQGAALGIAFEVSGTKVFAFPGVPSEYRAMAEQELAPEMATIRNGTASVLVAGWPESLLKDRLAPVISRLELHISILPSPGLVEIFMRGDPEDVVRAENEVRLLVPGDCLPPGARSLEEAVIQGAARRGLTSACAESCTGGLVGAALTAIPGSSAVFFGSAVCYSNSAKKSILSVSDDTLKRCGAVSSQCAAEMAEGALRVFGTDVSVSITGIAGPEGGSADKPVGTVWFGIAGKGSTKAVEKLFHGDRNDIRGRASMFALQCLWRKVSETEE
ncbi:nicotinamide-nucleotide amidohydrolase family protein [Aminivibrio sp.]|uniref:nicotinamide-nucleotide amidohydrolase family protein n=1 Tax=Aminivibrio sp. TaxID=1872489 RepID=UPI001A5D1F7F|nr:nicotinamide-nucleotide amidohydrolase family protein [Aminivibrio sp.]MBL3539685.1 nicotinamide-nucleotide amidohydrolase family protein [Aminivibrio sp.]MDK2958557.1 nicotinamide-nucleotide amidase [Synergistaceae bacterium]